MNILVVNAGSSSLKYQLIDMENEHVLAKGNCERIGSNAVLTHKAWSTPFASAVNREMSTSCRRLRPYSKRRNFRRR